MAVAVPSAESFGSTKYGNCALPPLRFTSGRNRLPPFGQGFTCTFTPEADSCSRTILQNGQLSNSYRMSGISCVETDDPVPPAPSRRVEAMNESDQSRGKSNLDSMTIDYRFSQKNTRQTHSAQRPRSSRQQTSIIAMIHSYSNRMTRIESLW